MSQGPVKREMTSDDAKRRKMTWWTILGIHLEVAWKLPVPPMLNAFSCCNRPMRNGFSCWMSPVAQARMDINRTTLHFSGWAMHEGFLFRAICTMEL